MTLRECLVAFGVGAHPALRRRARERTAHLRRRAQGERALGDLGLGRHERSRCHHRAGADARPVEYRRTVADEALLAERCRVDRAIVPDRRAGADLSARAGRDVHDRAVLHVGTATDDDRVEVPAEHGVVPDGGALLDGDVADDHGGGRDERGGMDLRTLALEAEQWHGLDPRSILEVPTSYSNPPRQEEGMPLPKIAAVATATPPHRFTQAQLLALAGYRDEERRGFFRRSDIEGRHLWIDPASFRPDESVDELNDRFRAGALALSESAARRALAGAGWDAADVDFVATTTCTGRLTPSLDAHLIGRLGCRADVQRVHVGDTGCASAMVALQQASSYVAAFPGRRALVVAVEICSAAYFLDNRLESAVAHAIFADGAGALAVTTDDVGPSIVAHRTLFRPEHLGAMGFEYPGGRLRVILSKDVRRIGASMMGEMAAILMSTQGLKREDIRYWVLHSAGRRVIDRARMLLDLSEEQVGHSRSVLRRYGNMSSATILFVLDETLRDEVPVPGDWGVMIALGPGFAAEGALLRW
ncbi:MAG: hypothetical protein DMD96_18625 [Candidatus Rokuibacteriota bacterium]|nr:MAG: hypothetical protein DMD96_18625 [Candidatus Rokubacteria bacterium]